MSQSREDMLNELCHLVSIRNQLQWQRQRARSRVGYYERIVRCREYIKMANRENREVFAHWLAAVPKKYMNATKGQMKSLIKRHQAEQLLAESKLHEHTYKTTKRVRALLRALGYRQLASLGTNRIHGLVPKEAHKMDGCDCHPLVDLSEMKSRAVDHVFESILLRDKEP